MNRAYHKSMKKTLYEAWGGQQSDLSHLCTFGTPVAVKKPGHHPSKAHPHVYHGIFLQFIETEKNIVYYDVNTDTIKVATHKMHNKFQYSSDKSKCTHASRFIIKLITDNERNDATVTN